MDGFNMEDGSGLSRLNAVSSAQMTAFLSYAYRQPFGTSYLESLSVSGVSGTLKNITGGTAAEGKCLPKKRIYAKGAQLFWLLYKLLTASSMLSASSSTTTTAVLR